MTDSESCAKKPMLARGRYFPLIMTAFVVVLLCSVLIGSAKSSRFRIPFTAFEVTFGTGNIFFPFSYIFGDILTEVYGYAQARKVIWAGFGSLLFATMMSAVIVNLPPDPYEPFNSVLQPALEIVFAFVWRVSIASIIAYWAGDFVNSYVMAKMKVWTKGKYLWTRTIGSTLCGQGVDSLIFYPLAFWGVWSAETILVVSFFNWTFKVLVEVVMTPFTYIAVRLLKRKEGLDVYDRDTNFTPFSLED